MLGPWGGHGSDKVLAQKTTFTLCSPLGLRISGLTQIMWVEVFWLRQQGRTRKMFGKIYQTTEVFGVSTQILEPSYVDRGALDSEIQRQLGRNTHIALRGESKCGKSWLRQRNIPNALTVQCRLNKKIPEIYVDALSQLGIKLTLEATTRYALKGRMEASSEFGTQLLAKIGVELEASGEAEATEKKIAVGHDITDLRYIAGIINASGRRLIIEDFHYLSPDERQAFAFDLKALWDYETYVVIIGIWADNNLLLHLNPDLSARVHEVSIFWSSADLDKVIERGSNALKVNIAQPVRNKLVETSFGTVGILQKLLIEYLDMSGVFRTQYSLVTLDDVGKFESAAMAYAEQLNAIYQTFATRVAKGIRTRAKSTGIYAHMLAVILDADDAALSRGLHLNDIFVKANKREPRIQKGNLRTVLEKLDGLQIDEHGRGLIVTYDSFPEIVSVVDKQILLYRRYATVRWPWEEIIESVESSNTGYDAEAPG
jgi:hypothetical protein